MIIEASNKVMSVGHQLDNLATVISFPVADIIADQGAGGNFYVRIQRKGDEAAYPSSNFSVDNGKLNLILTSSDLANVGEGQIQIRYTIGSKTVMSRVYKFYSHFSLDGSGTPPTPWTSWVQEVEDNADRAEEAVEHYPYVDETTGNWMQWDVENEEFVDTGVHAQGEQGEPGEPGEPGESGDDGVTFTPTVSTAGIISWTNDGGRENPTPRNIKGPRGSEVTVSNTGTATDEVQYITIDGTEKKIKGGTEDFEQLSNRPKYNGTVMDGDTDIPLHDSSKQDVISDLSNIRSGAALGATALQSVPNTYRTAAAQDVIDATKQNVIDDLSTIRSGAALGATALQSVPSTYRTAADQDVIDNTKQPKTDNLLSTVSKNVVGAINENKESIDNLKAIGRFLAVWNCTTGLPTTNPSTSPYTYKTGDYFLVGTVGTTNYKPNGSTYTIGVASTTVETNEVTVSDYYVYDGTDWILLKNTQKALTFANITGQPSDNSALNTALSGKVNSVSGSSACYCKNSSGVDSTVGYTSNANAYTLAFRTANGVMDVGTPTSNSHATTKQYVDTADAVFTNNFAITPYYKGTMGDGADANTMKTAGIYYVFSVNNYYNFPSGITYSQGYLFVLGQNGNSPKTQIYYNLNKNCIYHRFFINATWQSWSTYIGDETFSFTLSDGTVVNKVMKVGG